MRLGIKIIPIYFPYFSPDGLKRSTRQLLKDKSSVLESAIALKERVNHAPIESMKSRKRAYKPPGRPRKYFLDAKGEILENRDMTLVMPGGKKTFMSIDKLPKLIPINMNSAKTINKSNHISSKHELLENELQTNGVIEEDNDQFLKPGFCKIRSKNTARKMIKGNNANHLPG